MSGVLQGSVLGPILFLIYISDLDDSITSNVLKFADDTKLFRKINTDGDKKKHLQNDLDRLVKWSEKWQMLFNFGKCKCLHTGHGNLNVNYKMGDTVLSTTVKEKDLGVTIQLSLYFFKTRPTYSELRVLAVIDNHKVTASYGQRDL